MLAQSSCQDCSWHRDVDNAMHGFIARARGHSKICCQRVTPALADRCTSIKQVNMNSPVHEACAACTAGCPIAGYVLAVLQVKFNLAF